MRERPRCELSPEKVPEKGDFVRIIKWHGSGHTYFQYGIVVEEFKVHTLNGEEEYLAVWFGEMDNFDRPIQYKIRTGNCGYVDLETYGQRLIVDCSLS